MLFSVKTYGRAGLLGNPSDGYYGKTIALALSDFPCTVTIYESPEIRIEHNREDNSEFSGLSAMVKEIERFGYYGGVRLVKATIRQFYKYCVKHDIDLPRRNFTIRYASKVPQLVGMGGSSAICTATFKALVKFYEVADKIPFEMWPTLCWQAEQDLGIQCGMQDRVIQIYDGLMYMDFSEDYFKANDHGIYERLSPDRLPKLYIAYAPDRAEFSGIYHYKLRVLYDEKKRDLVQAMSEFAEYARLGRDAIIAGQHEKLAELINMNFDLRCRVLKVAEENARMVFTARKAGASAKFAGSGGAIIGTYEDETMFERLRMELEAIGCNVLSARIALPQN